MNLYTRTINKIANVYHQRIKCDTKRVTHGYV